MDDSLDACVTSDDAYNPFCSLLETYTVRNCILREVQSLYIVS